AAKAERAEADAESGAREPAGSDRDRERQDRACADVDAEHERADDEREGRDEDRVRHRRKRAAEEQREPAGRRAEQRGQRLEPALVPHHLRHPEEARHGGDLDPVADQEEAVGLERDAAAQVGEEDDLEERIAQQDRDVDPRAEPVEERAVARQAADEEDAEPVPHDSAKLARSRATRSKWPRKPAARTTYAALSRTHIPIAGQASPP